MVRLQYLLFADASQSLLIVLQGLDAAGKDGVVRSLFSGTNPQGVAVHAFKEPTPEELAHDFLWRAHLHTPGRGQVAIFNRSHYEDVLVVRVHKLVERSVWSKRFRRSTRSRMLPITARASSSLYLHISPEEQLERFKRRLDDPTRQWKISESDYPNASCGRNISRPTRKRSGDEHQVRALVRDPSNHKWFRNVAISQIVCDTMGDMGLKLPSPRVDLADIRRKYHAAERGDVSKD